MPAVRRLCRHTSLPSYRSSSICDDASENCSTAGDVLPASIPLQTVQIGKWKYVSSELGDIELRYEPESSDLVISTNLEGTGGGVAASFHIHSISAVNLSLVCIRPGSMESMVAKLIVETDSKIRYRVKHSSLSLCGDKMHQTQESKDLDIEIVNMTACVHESGSLRDVCLKCNYSANINPDQSYRRPQEKDSKDPTEQQYAPRPALLEWLPYWASYIPWMMYSKKKRKLLQVVILTYYIITVLWAIWQLYRHVNVIQILMQPFIETLKLYFSSVVETFDCILKVFTDLWHTYLSPLNVLCTILLTKLFNLISRLKMVLLPLVRVVNHLLQKSRLFSVINKVSYVVVMLLHKFRSILSITVSLVLRPFFICWLYTINSRLKVASMDLQHVKFKWMISQVMNSIKSILQGLLNLARYQWRALKLKKATWTVSTQLGQSPTKSLIRSPGVRRRKPKSPSKLI